MIDRTPAWLVGVLALAAAAAAGPVRAQGQGPGPGPGLDKGFECLIEPAQIVEIRSQVEGIIASIAVQRGDSIRRGQVLVELQSTAERAVVESSRYRAQMQGQIAAARNRIDYATRKLERLADLQRDNFTSAQARDEADAEKRLAESELQSATEARELAQLELARAQEQLAQRTVTAPFNGVVVDRMLNPGDLAEAGSGRKPVLKVAQIDPMRADVALPAALFGKVKAGTRASVVAVVGGGRFAGTVRNVDRVIDAASGTFIVRLELPNPSGAIPGGSRCSAQIDGLAAQARPRP
jgi:RND family efflux transporter MFP subunit